MMDKFRVPGLYANGFCDDDHWKLQYQFFKKTQNFPDIFLGWVKPDISQSTYLHKRSPELNNRRPVLLFGDSFANCMPSEKCFNEILNSDEEFNKDFYLLNYGVGGYGLDQIYLLFKHSIANYQVPIVIASLMTLDMDRSILSVRSGPKPRFKDKGEGFELLGAPVNTNHQDYFSKNPTQIHSYLYRLLLRHIDSLPADHNITMCEAKKHQTKVQVNQYLISEFIRDLKSMGFPYMFLIFHPQNEVLRNNDDWRDQLLHQTLASQHIPYISSKNVLREQVQVIHRDSLSDYYIQNDGHPTTLQNLLIAEEIKKFVLHVGEGN